MSNEATLVATPSHRADERFKAIVVTLMSLVTILSALVAFLQNDASNRSSTLLRDGQRFAVTQMETTLRSQQQLNYDTYVYQQWSGLSWQRAQDLQAATQTAQAQVDQMTNIMQLTADFSPLTQPPYLTDLISGTPDLARYFAEAQVEPSYWQQRREAAVDEGNAWNNKSAAYVTVLTLMAVSLFLFGLATTIGGRLRGSFVVLGIFIALAGSGWAALTVMGPVPQHHDEAVHALAQGHADMYRAETLRGWGQMDAALPYFQSGVDHLNHALSIDPDYANALNERAAAYLQAGEQQVFERQDASQFLQYSIDDYLHALKAGSADLSTLWNLGWAYYLLGNHPDSLVWTNRAIEKAPQQIGLYLNRAVALLALGQKEAAFAAVQQGFEQAAKQPISSANFYFHQAIYDLTQLLRAWPNADLQSLLADIKEKYVSLRYRHGAPVEITGAKIDAVTFGSDLDANDDVTNVATRFSQGTEQVYVAFSYTGLKAGGQVEALVYYKDREDESLTVLETSSLDESGAAWIRIVTPFINAGGLASGHYRVDIHVEGQLLASGEFDIE